MIKPVASGDLLFLIPCMERVIVTSVDGSAAERAAFVKNVRENAEWWVANPDRAVHLKCIVDDRIVGVVLIKEFWNLCSLFVEPAYHRQGIGRALVQKALKQCATKLRLRPVQVSSARNAVPFYTSLGFEVCAGGVANEAAVPMELRL